MKLPSSYPYLKASLWVLALFGVACAINLYYINKLVIFESGVWLPPLSFRYQTSVLFSALREHLTLIIGFTALSFTIPFQLTLRQKADPKHLHFLYIAFTGLYSLFALDQIWLELQGLERSNHALFFVLTVALILGWRTAVAFGFLNWLVLGFMYHWFIILPSYPSESYFSTLVSETHLFAPIFLAAFVGLVAQVLDLKRFSLVVIIFLFPLSECLLSLATLISTWAPPFFFKRFTQNLLVNFVLSFGLWGLIKYQLKRSSQSLQLTQHELALVQAELRALRAQINPHFMLNSLSVIHHLIRTKPDEARDLVLDLSDVFQRTLRAGDFVALKDELEHVKSYLALEQARLTDRLEVQWSILAKDKLDLLVPTLILQPIVENAVQHGIAPQASGGLISIVIQQIENDVCIEVADNGVGFDRSKFDLKTSSETTLTGHSIGLKNIDYRLRLLYGQSYKLSIHSQQAIGTTVSLRIPCQTDSLKFSLHEALAKPENKKALTTT